MSALRQRVLIIPNVTHWALGRIAREVAARLENCAVDVASYYYIDAHREEFNGAGRHYDIVHHLVPQKFAEVSALLGPHPTNVVSLHHVENWESVRACAMADHLVVAASEWRDFLIQKGVHRDGISVIPYGVDSLQMIPLPTVSRAKLRRRLGLGTSAFVVGCFGRQIAAPSNRKAPEMLIQSMLALKALVPNLAFLSVGWGWGQVCEPLRQAGISIINEVLVADRLMRGLFNALDCYWVTSRLEGGPIPLIEAMSCGVPVVSTAVGMARDLIVDGDNGFLVEKDDEAALVAKTMRLAQDAGLRQRVVRKGREDVEKAYQWSHHTSKVEELYRSLSSSSVFGGVSPADGGPLERGGAVGRRRRAMEEELLWIRMVRTFGERRRARCLLLNAWVRHLLCQCHGK